MPSDPQPGAADPVDQAIAERRLGLLILENKSGAALAAGIPHLRAAADLWTAAGRPSRTAECLADLGRLHGKLGDHPAAAAAFGEALRIFDGLGEPRAAMEAAAAAGTAYLRQGAVAQGLPLLRRAVELAVAVNDHVQTAYRRTDLAGGLIASRDPAAALAELDQALRTFVDFRKGIQQATVLELMGRAHGLAGDHVRAGECYERSAALQMELARSFEATETLARYAEQLRDRGELDAALAVHDRCLAVHRQAGSQALEAQTLRRIGMIRVRQQRYDEAEAAYQRSRDLCQAVEDRDGASRSLYLLGAVAARRGDHAAAVRQLDASRALAEAHGNLHHQEQALAALANVHRAHGEHDLALAAMQRWVAVLKQLGERADTLKVLGQIAELHRDRGRADEAIEHLRRLLAVATRDEDAALRSRAQGQLGLLLARHGDVAEAIDLLEQAAAGDPVQAPRLLEQAGTSQLMLGDAAAAEAAFARGLAALDAGPDPQGEAQQKLRAKLLVGLGNAHAAGGRRREAADFFDRAAALAESRGDVRATTIIRKATRGLTGQ